MGPLSALMGWIFNLIYNLFYGLNIYSIGFSIIVFTFIVRLLLFPINLKTTKSSKIQQYLQPEFNKITKKYKGKKDQESMMKQNKEGRGYHQSGCLALFTNVKSNGGFSVVFSSLFDLYQKVTLGRR